VDDGRRRLAMQHSSVMQDIEIVVTPHDEKRELNCVVSAVGRIGVDGCHGYRHL
jgi:hypothetical protein